MRRSRGGRIDNPDFYRVFYCSLTPTGAVGEKLASEPRPWRSDIFDPDPEFRDGIPSIGTFDIGDKHLLNLDSHEGLADWDLRPSRVVTTGREVTHGWALQIFQEGSWDGIRWWSRWISDWPSLGIWNQTGFRVAQVERLTFDHPAVDAARTDLSAPIGEW